MSEHHEIEPKVAKHVNLRLTPRSSEHRSLRSRLRRTAGVSLNSNHVGRLEIGYQWSVTLLSGHCRVGVTTTEFTV